MFAEAIPAGVLQMYAFIKSPNRTNAAAGSIIISALTTGFGSALISYGELILMYKVRCGAAAVPRTPRSLTSSSSSQSSITDKDTSPNSRRVTPDFYGFVPPTGRGLIFVLMVVNSTSQFLAKIMAIGLLGAVSKTWTVAYLVGDMCLFLLYKLLRNDFFYWIPVQSYVGSIAVSLFHRILEKVRVFWKE